MPEAEEQRGEAWMREPEERAGTLSRAKAWLTGRGWLAGTAITLVSSIAGATFFGPSIALSFQRRGWTQWGADLLDRTAEILTSLPALLLIMAAFGFVVGRVSLRLPLPRALTEDEFERALGVPVLGSTPRLRGQFRLLEEISFGPSPLSEAYEQLRSVLSDRLPSDKAIQLMVTGVKGSGKSSTVLALGRSFSAIGHRVLIIDADLRKPSFYVPGGTGGLSSILAGMRGTPDLVEETGFDRLFLLPAGPLPPNPGELIARFGVDPEIADLKQRFDVILVDTSGLQSGAIEIARYCGNVLYVQPARGHRLSAARRALRPLKGMSGVRLFGLITKGPDDSVPADDLRRPIELISRD